MNTQNYLTQLMAQIGRMRTIDEIKEVSSAKARIFGQLTPEQTSQVNEAIVKRFDELAEVSDSKSGESIKILTQTGLVIDAAEWLTIKRYTERYNLKMNTVMNWIERGVIPADCTVTVHELNDMKLVKNRLYR